MKRVVVAAMLVVVLIVTAGGAAAARRKLERIVESAPQEQELLYLPNGKYLRFASLGHESLVADIVYLWAIQFYSNYEREGRYRYVQHIFGEVIPDLDPLYVDPYWLGAMILVVEVGDVEAGLALLDQGFANNPRAWILPYLAGWEAERAGQPVRAAGYFREAAAVEGAPRWVRRMEAGMLARAGRIEDAIRSWRDVLEDPESDAASRAIAERWLRKLEVRRQIDALEAAITAFHDRHGRFPTSPHELVRSGEIRALPTLPEGASYEYDPESGRVTSEEGRILRGQR